MPPPKRPKSEVVWTTLCTEAESGVQERSCCNVDDSLQAVSDDALLDRSYNTQHVHHADHAVAMLNPSTSQPNIVVSAVSCESPLDLRRTDVDDRLVDTGDVTGSRRATTLRRLLLEPVTPASDLHRSATSPASAAHSECERTVVKHGRTNLCTQPIVVPSTAACTLKTDTASSRNLPSAALRRILLTVDDYNDADSNRPVTTSLHQSNDSLFVRLATTGSGLDRSASSVASAVVRALPQQSFSASDNRCVSQTTLSLSSKYAVLTDRLECRDLVVAGEESKFTEQQRKTSSSLK